MLRHLTLPLRPSRHLLPSILAAAPLHQQLADILINHQPAHILVIDFGFPHPNTTLFLCLIQIVTDPQLRLQFLLSG